MRPKRLDRVQRNFNIDKEIDDWLREKHLGEASEIINSLLKEKYSKDEKKGEELVGSDTKSGTLAYAQAMEKLNLPPNTPWKSLEDDDQLTFVHYYKRRLAELQARGL